MHQDWKTLILPSLMVPLNTKEFNAKIEQTAYIICIYVLINCPPFLLCNIKLSHVYGGNISTGRCVKIQDQDNLPAPS